MKSVLQDNQALNESQWAYVPLMLFFIAAFFSKFLVSVSVGLMALALIAFYRTKLNSTINQNKSLLGAFALLFGFVLLDGFRLSGDYGWWMAELLLKLPYLIVPLYGLSLDPKSCRFEKAMLVSVLLTALVGLASVGNYLMHYDEINQLLLQSKHVPIFGRIHHIYYGVLVALGIWVSMYFTFKGVYKKVWIVLVVILVLLLHILASRTGLLSFYISLLVFGFFYSIRYKKWKAAVVVTALVILLPTISTVFSKSFRNKLLNSQEDLIAITGDEDLNYKSLGMRMEAWETTLDIIASSPIIGVGAHNIDREMKLQYVRNKTSLFQENRIGPHSQILEATASHGIFGLSVLVVLFLIILRRAQFSPLAMAILALLAATMCFESFLERQLGIVTFGFYITTFVTKLLPNRDLPNKLD